MVDNENQWENTEYFGNEDDNMNASYGDSANENENSGFEDDYQGQDYSDDSMEQNDEYDDDSLENYDDLPEENSVSGKKNSPLLLILLLLVLAGACIFAFRTKFTGSSNVASNNQSEVVSQNVNNENMGDFFFDEAGGNSDDMMSVNFDENGNTNVADGNAPQNPAGENQGEVVMQVSDAPDENLNGDDLFSQNSNNNDEGTAIMISYAPAVRANPFKPPVAAAKKEEKPVAKLGNVEFEIIEPPVSSVEDTNITTLLQTKISGIMYDEDSPAAVVNLNGSDYFVKEGDKVAGYQIDSITKDKVAIRYKNNSYVASVGELFSPGELTKKPAVANLENKFGGRYKNNN